ncbi:ATP-binding protein [Parasediminibacterium sp. JCM 36343]|uniref:tetratricopeptide repeat-containing sensor histidine kinase n=1 Tax=Parasediminibacterium sp. JCM 36343 TaxID=3374279 RepID=UPI00397AAA6E
MKHQQGYQKDTVYITTLCLLSKGYYSLDADSMRYFARTALSLSQQSGYLKGQAESLRLIASSYRLTSDMVQMFNYYQQSLSIAEKIKDKRLIAKVNSNLGIYYSSTAKYDEALLYTRKAYQTYVSMGSKPDMAGSLSDLGDDYFYKKQYDSALYYNQLGFQLAVSINNPYIIAFINSSIGNIHFANGRYQEALLHFTPSYHYYISTKDKLGKINTSVFIGQCYLKLNRNDSAIFYASQALEAAQSIKLKREPMDASEILAGAYQNKKDIAHAFTYFKLFKTYSDSVFNEDTRKKTYELETKYAYEKKERARQEEQERKDFIAQNELQNARQKTLLAALSAILACLAAVVLYISRANKQKSNLLLNEKNQKISKQKEELEKQAKALEVNNHFKDKLFSIVSHDLRSPLNSLKGVLNLWQRKKIQEAQLETLVAGLTKQVNNASDLVATLFNWANSQMNGLVVTPANINILETSKSTFALLQEQANEKQLDLQLAIPEALEVYADPNMVQIIFRNLVSNAIKFCNKGNTIQIEAVKANAHTIEIRIKDTGTGINEDVLKKIQNHESITTNGTSQEKGTGLGLLLCKEFVEKNGGQFWVTSEVGKGSIFYFTLPAVAMA